MARYWLVSRLGGGGEQGEMVCERMDDLISSLTKEAGNFDFVGKIRFLANYLFVLTTY